MTSTDPAPPTIDSAEGSEDPAAPPASDWMRLAVHAALDRKAEDLKVLQLGKLSGFTDYFLICTGRNERQVQAIIDAIDEALRKVGARPLHSEGYNHARWVLLDYGGEMVIHVFHEETRRFYGLERLWADAPDVTADYGEPAVAAGS